MVYVFLSVIHVVLHPSLFQSVTLFKLASFSPLSSSPLIFFSTLFVVVQVFLPSVISCREQPCHLISLCPYVFTQHIFLLFSYLSRFLLFLFYLSIALENFISPFLCVRQEPTSIFVCERQGLWLTPTHRHTFTHIHTHNRLAIHLSHSTQHISFSPTSCQIQPSALKYSICHWL